MDEAPKTAGEEAPPALPKRRGGRKRGALNKKTLLRLQHAEKQVAAHHRKGKKIAVDHMDDIIDYLRGLVTLHQPWDGDGNMIPGKSEKLWFRCLDAFRAFLALRAPYQSPALASVAIIPMQERPEQKTVVNVTILNDRGETVFTDEEQTGPLIEHDADEAAA